LHYNKTLVKFTPISIFDNCYSAIQHFCSSVFAVTLRPKLLDHYISSRTEKWQSVHSVFWAGI